MPNARQFPTLSCPVVDPNRPDGVNRPCWVGPRLSLRPSAQQTVLETFHRLGTTGEGIEQFRMVALDIPTEADIERIRKLLEHGNAKGWWHRGEGCVTAAWRASAGLNRHRRTRP
ncbi:DUF4265 domain-containing protein [Kitasatospora sp. NPDC056138]|uniref:DUF4265 domain-containing protein n=1 Tax=Kitasatospora sp. NPDC056138 TaxID=3345724 RepID=UPI0035D6D44A